MDNLGDENGYSSMRLRARQAACLLFMLVISAVTGPSANSMNARKGSMISHRERRFPDRPSGGEWGDQRDGTYVNPIMPGDFSDLDAIRVASDYYAISSTLQYSPGMVILHSKDLVNWKIIGHVVKDLTVLDPELNWDKMNRAGRGIWAGSIRYYSGLFRVYFGTPDQGIFVSTAATASGPWSPAKLVLRGSGWDDPCPFWEGGQGYLVATHFAPEGRSGTTYNIHLFQMKGDQALQPSDQVIHQSPGSEANKLYKIHGLYYHYYSEVQPEGRVIMMERARSLKGPWEIHQLIHVHGAVDKEPNQGGLLQLPSGKWYFVSHQGRGDWEGRAGVLLPVTWMGGWPIIGRVGPDGIGGMVWRGKKPIMGFAATVLSLSDDFDAPLLKPEWEWNYQPRADKWSLSERPGFLRLHAFPSLRPNDFSSVGNVITQRAFRTTQSQATVKLDLSGMSDGQEAGLAHFAKTYATISILQAGGVRSLSYLNDGRRTSGPVIAEDIVFLRSSWGFDGRSRFSYSFDGLTYQPFGDFYDLTWGSYRGDRVGLFTVNPNSPAGFVDVDSFQYSIQAQDDALSMKASPPRRLPGVSPGANR